MQRFPVPYLLIGLVVLGATSGCAASSEPCEKLLKQVCSVGGDSLCEQVREQQASRADDPAAVKACADLLDDPVRLGQVLDGLRAAALLKVSLSGDAEGVPEKSATDAPKGAAPKRERRVPTVKGASAADGGNQGSPGRSPVSPDGS